MFSYTIALIGVSAAIFSITRHFARPPPKTLTKEYQAMTDEYLKVTTPPSFFQKIGCLLEVTIADMLTFPVTKHRAHHRYFFQEMINVNCMISSKLWHRDLEMINCCKIKAMCPSEGVVELGERRRICALEVLLVSTPSECTQVETFSLQTKSS